MIHGRHNEFSLHGLLNRLQPLEDITEPIRRAMLSH